MNDTVIVKAISLKLSSFGNGLNGEVRLMLSMHRLWRLLLEVLLFFMTSNAFRVPFDLRTKFTAISPLPIDSL